MEKLFKAGMAVLLSVACIGVSSCSDDDEMEPEVIENQTPGTVNPSNVFTGLAPKSVGGTTITRNSDGLVTEMRTADGKVITFSYPAASRADENQNNVLMTILEEDLKSEYSMFIGSNGFVSNAHFKVTSLTGDPKDEEEGDWAFSYDGEGHLTNARHIYNDIQGEGDYSVTLRWENGNLVSSFKESGWDSYTYLYTSADYPQPLENKGAIFMFESIYPIEIYDFEWVYYAGMLGKGPRNLAVASYGNDDEDSSERYVDEYVWTLDANGYPTLFDVKDDDHPGYSTVKFTWN